MHPLPPQLVPLMEIVSQSLHVLYLLVNYVKSQFVMEQDVLLDQNVQLQLYQLLDVYLFNVILLPELAEMLLLDVMTVILVLLMPVQLTLPEHMSVLIPHFVHHLLMPVKQFNVKLTLMEKDIVKPMPLFVKHHLDA